MYIPRQAESLLHKALNSQKVVLLLGARQVGKTTLIRHILPKEGGLFLNLDLPVDQARLQAAASLTPLQALRSLGNPQALIIDEAQRWPEVGVIMKAWYDAGLPTQLVLLGSSSLNLLDRTAESLAGRNWKVELPPLTFRESLTTQEWYSPEFTDEEVLQHFGDPLGQFLHQALIYGSYPEVFQTDDREQYLLNLAADYVLKDFLHHDLIRSSRPILHLLTVLARQSGQELSTNQLAKQINLNRLTVDKYLDLLERSYLIFRLPPYSTGRRGEIARSQKIYFWDTGLRNALLKDFNPSPFRADLPSLFENWAIAEIAKQNLLNGNRCNLSFWRTVDGASVDVIIEENGKLRAMNLAWEEHDRRTSRAFQQQYGCEVEIIGPEQPLLQLQSR
jgi:hypothetical protein